MVGRHSNVIVLGSGPAGYTAALYAARAMLKPLLIFGEQPGGQLTTTTDVENYPGFSEVIQGPWLMEQMRDQAHNVGAEMIQDQIVSVNLEQTPFELTGELGDTYSCNSLIICTGAQAKWLGLESEETFKGFGVSACATCDGFFFRDKKVVVVGGGNTAVEEALFLTKFASEVILLHRRDELRAEKILQQRLFEHKKISVRWNAVLERIEGGDDPKLVSGVVVNDTRTGISETISCDGVFIAIGHKPSTELFADQLQMKPGGYLVTVPGSTTTNIPGVFAAGDVTDDVFRQAVTAAGMGCMAALEAERFLSGI